jgi:hypothetical protein
MIVQLVFLALWQTATLSSTPSVRSCVLAEGSGADFGRIGITTRDKAGPTPRGVTLEYEGAMLVRLFVTNDTCKTSKGIKVGDSQDEVQRSYGNGKRTTVKLMKGATSSVGKLGDVVLVYPGVAFVMSNGRVAGVFIEQVGKLSVPEK